MKLVIWYKTSRPFKEIWNSCISRRQCIKHTQRPIDEGLQKYGARALCRPYSGRGSVVVSTPAYHAADRGSNPASTRRDYYV